MNLNKDEEKWLKRLQEVMDSCPSKRLGFFTIGDSTVMIYDRTRDREINEHNGGDSEFVSAAQDLEACFYKWINFPSPVHAVRG